MDWKIFTATFVTIFIAELGDKTQIAALVTSSQTKSTLSVLLAVVLALSCAGVIGVLAGRLLGEAVDPVMLRYGAGVVFILMGVWMIWGIHAGAP